MKSTRSVVFVILGLLILTCVPVLAAGVHNVALSSMAGSTPAITGTATTIVGDVAGPNPYQNVEINIKVDQAPASNMVYQAWLVDTKDNMKTSLGAFNGSAFNVRQRMVGFMDSGPYDTIAVSLEPANDANPSPATIVAQGTLPGTLISATDFPTMAILPSDESFQETAITKRFSLTNDQFASLRMQGFGYSDIALIGSTASTCKKSPNDVAAMVSQGQQWDQIAASCNTTTASLFEPSPQQAVAGSIQETGPGMMAQGQPGMMVRPYRFYLKYPNGTPVMTARMWREYRIRGNSWQDVCIASNISSYTGEKVDDLLRMATIQGMTWREIAFARGLSPDQMQNTSKWPFSKDRKDDYLRNEREVLPGHQPEPESMSPSSTSDIPTY